MKCDEIRETMPDLAAGLSTATPAIEEHLHTCADCSAKLTAMRQTMSLLDEWQVPEPSPYFDVRLQARLREEIAKPSPWAWFRRPALAFSLTILLAVGVMLVSRKTGVVPVNPDSGVAAVQTTTTPVAAATPGSAVGDLQALDRNDDLYANFDVLDDLQVQDDVTATP